MKELELEDKATIEKYLHLKDHSLSAFSFANIYIWKGLFKINWEIIDGALCIFMQDDVACFMYLPPLGKISREIIERCFKIMDAKNANKSFSRIENAEKRDLDYYKMFDLVSRFRFNEYLYLKKNLVSLAGDDYKSKRSAYNYFVKNYKFKIQNFQSDFQAGCLALFKNWVANRKAKNSDPIYQKMLEDNYSTHSLAMKYYKPLGLVGRIIKIDDKIKAYSFGFKLNKDTFCVLFEVTDLEIKGLSQFIFREFVRGFDGFSFINVMDDSGLENLKKVKSSYKPIRLESSYAITRN
ncbi:MAG: phosphatidylglycerol lysyltransferase domain-containing protein [Candidatus Omnitrophica bacterium]|nr:phosphatidylglycerol lysyltransferase domain-containing protein [Candidatus Omnitrophota bacterium]HOX54095.1 phosphatidylglycerol lysyltransferase domain-containing protein [Candidatus Omnitrophota bacterium]